MNSKGVLLALEDETDLIPPIEGYFIHKLVVLIVSLLLIPPSDRNIKVAYQVSTRSRERPQLHTHFMLLLCL